MNATDKLSAKFPKTEHAQALRDVVEHFDAQDEAHRARCGKPLLYGDVPAYLLRGNRRALNLLVCTDMIALAPGRGYKWRVRPTDKARALFA
jgi:hypothetical protein